MTRTEKYSWASFLVLGAIFLGFVDRMLDGWAIAERSAGGLLSLYIGVVIITTIATIIVASVTGAIGGSSSVVMDERDLAIEAKANRNAFYFLIGAVNVIIVHMLGVAAFPDRVPAFLDMSSPSAVVFVLLSTVFLATLVKLLSTIAYYRF